MSRRALAVYEATFRAALAERWPDIEVIALDARDDPRGGRGRTVIRNPRVYLVALPQTRRKDHIGADRAPVFGAGGIDALVCVKAGPGAADKAEAYDIAEALMDAAWEPVDAAERTETFGITEMPGGEYAGSFWAIEFSVEQETQLT